MNQKEEEEEEEEEEEVKEKENGIELELGEIAMKSNCELTWIFASDGSFHPALPHDGSVSSQRRGAIEVKLGQVKGMPLLQFLFGDEAVEEEGGGRRAEGGGRRRWHERGLAK